MEQRYVQTRRNMDGTSSTFFPILALSMDELSRALSAAGFVRNHRAERKGQLPKQVYDAILESNPRHAQMIRSGDAMFNLLEHRQYVNPNTDGVVDLSDHELRRVETLHDPFVHMTYLDGDRTPQQAKDITVDLLKKKFVTIAYSEGETSKRAKRCIMEVALLAGISAEQAVNECMQMLQFVEGKLGPKSAAPMPETAYPSYWTDRVYERNPAGVTPRTPVLGADEQAQTMMREHEHRMHMMEEETGRMIVEMQRETERAIREMNMMFRRNIDAQNRIAAQTTRPIRIGYSNRTPRPAARQRSARRSVAYRV